MPIEQVEGSLEGEMQTKRERIEAQLNTACQYIDTLSSDVLEKMSDEELNELKGDLIAVIEKWSKKGLKSDNVDNEDVGKDLL
ncbi:MAG: hypothetical protein WC663_05710 [Patescibacteria group bacterium]|jgi:hypothetical protein